MYWFAGTKVTLYEVSDAARIEVRGVGNRVDAPIAAKLVVVRARLGQWVSAGAVLFELDSSILEQKLAEACAKRDALAPQIEARRSEIAAVDELLALQESQRKQTRVQTRARGNQAGVRAQLAAEEAKRRQRLFDKAQLVSESELARARGESAELAAAARAARAEIGRADHEMRSTVAETSVRAMGLHTELIELESQEASAQAAVGAIERDLELRKLRAPIDGELADVAPYQVGAFVSEGAHLAIVVPRGELRVVAEFAPAFAFGRVARGQSARVRLDGFPWTQYGALSAMVSEVGTEVRDGRVRVEFDLGANASTRIPIQHGLPGIVEVAVEEVSPLRLTTLTVGRLLGERPASLDPPVTSAPRSGSPAGRTP
jgi:membrane fusion protein (multidrug efflux system)